MPEYLRALVAILALATTVFAFVKAPACAVAFTTEDFERRRNLWYGITLVAFLAQNFWIFVIGTAFLLLLAIPRESNKLALYYFLLFAVPTFGDEITGLGVIRFLFEINYLRLLALTILLPAFLFLWKQPDTDRLGRSVPDKLILGYIVLNALLMLNASTFTNTMRYGVFYAFIDIFLPYYVASRLLKNIHQFREALMGFVVAALILSAIGAVEFMKHWLLYSSLSDALGVSRALGGSGSGYLERGDGVLRAQATAGQAIPLGYVIAVAIGFFMYLGRSVPSAMARVLGLSLLIAGLIAPVSRGPWVGAAVMLLVFLATSPSPGRRLIQFGAIAVIVLPVLLTTSVGEKIISYLPFVGTVEEQTVTYRQRLLEISIGVVLRNPFFGAYDYLYSPQMQELKGGQGIIDVVNSYLAIALSSGLVGLSLFAGFFIAVAIGIFTAMRTLADRSDELYLLGQGLFSVLLGILVIIATVSSITFIPVIYWSVAGLGVAYARMLALAKLPVRASDTAANASAFSDGSRKEWVPNER